MRKKLTLCLLAILVILSPILLYKTNQQDIFKTIVLSYQLDDYDENGNLCYSKASESHSYVIAFIDGLYCGFAGATVTLNDTAGSSRASIQPATSSVFKCASAIGSVVTGIVAGTGTNAVTISDYSLQTLIAHGTGAGQLSYAVEQFSTPSTVSSTRSFTTFRTLTNNSGNTITINEIGIYAEIGATYKFMTARDIIAGGQAVATGHSVVITYTIAITA
jgi:hypothetical protein